MDRAKWIAIVLYVIVMAGIVFGMNRAKRWAADNFSPAAAQQEWDSFRDDVAQSNETSPVRRRVPKSNEPPALVLLRDYYGVCLAISLVLTTAVYATMTFFTLGVLKQNPTSGSPTSADERGR